MTTSPAPISLAIAGLGGRMGRALLQTASSTDGFQVTGGSEHNASPQLGQDIGVGLGLPTGTHIPVVRVADAAKDAHVWIDFTTPAATLAALDALKSTPVKAVIIGTTGFSAAEDAAIQAAAEYFTIVKSGNYSLGVNVLAALSAKAAQLLGPEWDIEITETHHNRKVDAPSGTALLLGDAVADAKGAPLNTLRSAPYETVVQPREPGTIGFSVRRMGGVVGAHTVAFGSEREIIELSHTALDRGLFADGALHAAKWAMTQPPGLYSMLDALGL